jgi:hypothetical protein
MQAFRLPRRSSGRLAGMPMDAGPAATPASSASGCRPGRHPVPSDENQLPPQLGDHISRIALKNSTAFHKRFRVPSIRSKQDNEVIGQLAIHRMTHDQPSELCLLFDNPCCISWREMGSVVMTRIHFRHFQTLRGGTKHDEHGALRATVPHAFALMVSPTRGKSTEPMIDVHNQDPHDFIA